MRRATITLNITAAFSAGEDRHPQVIMRELAHRKEFTISSWTERLGQIPQKMEFEVDLTTKEMPTLPAYCEARPRR